MVELPEIAKSYRREPVRRGFKAFVPAETAEARERRELQELYAREFNSRLNEWMVSNFVRAIGLNARASR
jgi:hypothetical protein